MDTETYKVALELLNRFGDKTNGIKPQSNAGGMVSLEDYEYSAFRCALCKVLNPAKKIRPKAPALSVENIGSTIQSSSSTSSSDKDSGSESEERNKGPVTLSDVSQQQTQSVETSTEATTKDNLQPSQSEEEKIDENVEEDEEEKSAIDKKLD